MLRDTIVKTVIFIVGAGLGSVVTREIIKNKYAEITKQEVEELRAYYKNKKEYADEAKKYNTESDDISEKETGNEPAEKKEEQKLYNYAAKVPKKQEQKVNEPDNKRPYVITPDDYGENRNYELVEFEYHSDGRLTDDRGEIVEDIDNVIGYRNLEHIGEYETNVVHIRNDILEADYEILQVDD